MKNFKRIFALMLALLMVFAIAGCGTTTTYESYYEEVEGDDTDNTASDVIDDNNDVTDYEEPDDTVTDNGNDNDTDNGNDNGNEDKDTANKPSTDKDTSSKKPSANKDTSSKKPSADKDTSSKKPSADKDTSSKAPVTNVQPGIQAGQVGDKIDASKWGIAESNKGIEDKVNLKGKTVRMLCFSTIKYQSAAFQRTVKAFENKYGCKVKITYAAFGNEYTTALRNAIAAKEPYDIAFMHASWSNDTIASNLYEPLNGSMTTADLLDKNNKGIDLTKSTEISWNGNIYGACGYRGVNPMIIFYNKVMFDRDFDEADDPRTLYENGKWTWDKFFELGSKVVDPANDKWFGGYNFFRVEICSTFGGNCVTIKNGVPTVTIDSDKYIAGMKNISKLGAGATKIIQTQTAEDQLENFLAGETYVYTEESDRYTKIMSRISTLNAFKKNGKNLGIVPLPLGETNTEKTYPTGWIETVVCPKGANPDIVIAWAKFSTTYDDPVTTDKTKMGKADQAMIDDLLKNINPRRCSYSDSSWSMGSLEWNLVTEAARGKDLSVQIKAYKPQMQSCIDATMAALNKLK